MREVYVKNIISKLVENYGFVVEEYEVLGGDKRDWVAIKYDESNTIAIIFSDSKDYEVKAKSLVDYTNSKSLNSTTLFNIIIDNLKDDLNYIPLEGFYNKIIIDEATGVLVKNSVGCDNFASLIEDLLQHKKKKALSKEKLDSKATYTLIAINVIVFIISAILSGSVLDIDYRVLLLLGAKNNTLINMGQYYRLFTAMFLHGGLLHVVLNMYALKATGEIVENFYGRKKFLIIYFISGILSSIASYVFSNSTSVGASGAIFGLLGACLVFAFKMKDRIGKGFLQNIISVIAVNIFIGLSISNIDNYGHIGGLIGGVLIALIVYKDNY